MSDKLIKQRIGIVSFEGPHNVIGGVQRRVAEEISYFSRNRSFEIAIIYSGCGDPFQLDGVSYYPITLPQMIYPLKTILFSFRAARLIQSLPPFDILETHHDAGFAAMLAGKKTYKRWVEVVHGIFLDEFLTMKKYYSFLSRDFLKASALLPLSIIEKTAVRKSDAVITVSGFAKMRLAELYKIPPTKVNIIPNGIRDEICKSEKLEPGKPKNSEVVQSKIKFLYAGRLDARKGILDLIQAFALTVDEIPEVELTIIGSGSQSAKATLLCDELGIKEKVNFRGNISDDELVAAYRSADVLCMPSLQEGQGIVALEAQACGLPVIGTHSGGLPEAVNNGETGFLVPPHDIQRLAEKMIYLVKNPQIRDQMSKRALVWAGNFFWKNQLKMQQSLFNDLLGDMNAEYKCALA